MKNNIAVLVFLLNFAAFAQDSFIKNESVYEINTTKSEIFDNNTNYVVSSTGINTKLTDVGSAFFKNKYVIYSSRKTGEIGAGKDITTKEPFTNLYCLNIDKYGNLSKPLFFSRLIKSDGNQGGVTFSPNERVIYYTKSTKENSSNYQLFKSDFDPVCNCKWSNEEAIAFNNPNFSIENPVVTADGKKMYFTSNMPGGFGGYDLYVANINEFNHPVNPVNLGKDINSSADETHPYITRNQKNIYFSSNGHSGFGGKDVFVSKIYKNSFSNPTNLGNSINTSADEIAFILASKTSGYVSSNRENTLGSFDVFRFSMNKIENRLSGITYKSESEIELPNTEISLIDNEGTLIAKQIADKNGAYTFDIDPSEKYTIVASKEGYDKFELPIITSNSGNSRMDIVLNQVLLPVIVTKENKTVNAIEKIYFEFNKSSLLKESAVSLNNLIILLNENKSWLIIINAHTDNKGSDTYNLELSEKRAGETKNYLVKNGIDEKRITAKGLGETESLSNCKEKCTKIELDNDRRVEFIIQ